MTLEKFLSRSKSRSFFFQGIVMLEPIEKPYDFWDNCGTFGNQDEFFVIFKRNTKETRTTGYWSAERNELLWLAESYLMYQPDTVYYINNMMPPYDKLGDVMDDAKAGIFFEFIAENTPQCMEYVLFHLSDMRLV